jgi:hypothetical protein
MRTTWRTGWTAEPFTVAPDATAPRLDLGETGRITGVGVAVYRVSLTDLITYPPSRDLSTACGCWLWADHPYGVACEPDADL